MRANQIITEKVVNLVDRQQKSRYAGQVWELLQRAYGSIGGFGSASDVDELIDDSGMWKLVTRDGKITALNIYKDKHGRKTIAIATDGTPRGKSDYRMLNSEDVRTSRAWAEVSGAPEHIMAKAGAKPIPSKYANFLTKKDILSYNPDGYHYTRMIAGHPHEKAIYGVVNLSAEDQAELRNQGIELHDLPRRQ